MLVERINEPPTPILTGDGTAKLYIGGRCYQMEAGWLKGMAEEIIHDFYEAEWDEPAGVPAVGPDHEIGGEGGYA